MMTNKIDGASQTMGSPTQRIVTILFLVSVPILTALFHDIHRSYITTIDADPVFVYEALRVNAGLDQVYSGHPGYSLFVLLAWWFKLMKVLGVISFDALDRLPPLRSDEFVVAYSNAMFAARYFIVTLTAVLVTVFFEGLRYLTRDWRVAAVVTSIFATSQGIGTHSLMIHTELPSLLFLFLAFISLIAASRTPGYRVMAPMFFCGICVVIAMLAKVQAVLIVLGLPVLMLIFGPSSEIRRYGYHAAFIDRQSVVLMVLLSFAFSIPAIHMIATSIAGIHGNGGYQILTALYVAGAMGLYCRFYKTPIALRLIAGAGLLMGISAGIYTIFINPSFHPINALANFLDHLFQWSFLTYHDGITEKAFSWARVFQQIWVAANSVVIEKYVHVDPISSPMGVLNWIVPSGILFAFYHRANDLAFKATAAFGLGFAMEIASSVHSVSDKVVGYFDIWKLIATAILLVFAFRTFRNILWRPVLAVSLIIFVVLQGRILMAPNYVRNHPESWLCRNGYMVDLWDGFERYCPNGG